MNASPATLAQEANNEILRSRYHRAIGNLIVAETALERQQENCRWLENEIQAIEEEAAERGLTLDQPRKALA